MTQPNAHSDSFTMGLTRKSLEATVIKACLHCRAPGVYSDAPSIEAGWPKCFDPTRVGVSVGNVCPQCSMPRGPSLIKELGEVNASIPLWIWNIVLGVKRLIIGCRRIKRRISGATNHGH